MTSKKPPGAKGAATANLYADFHLHPKATLLVDAGRLDALGLLTLIWSWCAKNYVRDGRITRREISGLADRTNRLINVLVDAGLLDAVDAATYQVHDWTDHNRSSEQIEQERERWRAAQSASRTPTDNQTGHGRQRPTTSRHVSRDTAAPTDEPSRETSRETSREKPPGNSRAVTGETGEVSGPALALVNGTLTGSAQTAPSVNPDKPPGQPATTAQTLVAEWVDHCRARPPERVIGQVAREVGALIAGGTDPGAVRAGLQRWAGLALNPSTIASVVNEILNPPTIPRGGPPKSRVTANIESANADSGLALAALEAATG